MASPGQKRGSYRDVMASFDGNNKCARCHDKGIETDECVLQKDLIHKVRKIQQIVQ